MSETLPVPKADLFGVGISVVDYEYATDVILEAARARRSLAVSALATHGLMLAVEDQDFRAVVNQIDVVTPDGQPIRWALNRLRRTGLADRVYGPDLVEHVCRAAARDGVSVYLFGSTDDTCQRLAAELSRRFPALVVAGLQADRFREATAEEDETDVRRINDSGAGIVLVGRGCPRQERWVADHRGRVQAAMLAVGAAFDYYAGTVPRPPSWMQDRGLEWAFRLGHEPRRLAGRYARYNTRFLLRYGRELATDRRRP